MIQQLRAAGVVLSLLGMTVAQGAVPAKNAFLVLVDGLRWQEVFGGADRELLTKEVVGEKELPGLEKKWWRESADERRELLMPFLWSTVAKKGQIFGNQNKGSVARVTNGLNFSYPGYSEMTVGYSDPRINSNDKKPNPNVTVFEWLHKKPEFAGQVAAFGVWDVVPFIVNRERAGFPVNACTEPLEIDPMPKELLLLNTLKTEIPQRWPGAVHDALEFRTMMLYVREKKPRVVWFTFGETDEFGHDVKYGEYLAAAQRTDAFLRELWATLESQPEYAGKTTLIVCADHGRGNPPKEWSSHGRDIKGSEGIWIAMLGPTTAPLGERTNHEPVWQAQVAATLAAALGEDFTTAHQKVRPPLK